MGGVWPELPDHPEKRLDWLSRAGLGKPVLFQALREDRLRNGFCKSQNVVFGVKTFPAGGTWVSVRSWEGRGEGGGTLWGNLGSPRAGQGVDTLPAAASG